MPRVNSLIVTLALLILAAACGNADTPVPTATVGLITTPTPTEDDSTKQIEVVLTKARQAMSEAQSYRFIADLSIQTDTSVRKTLFTAEWTGPDRYRMRVEELGEGTGNVQEAISVGGRVLVSDSDHENGAWTEPRSELYGISPRRITIPDLDDTVLLDDEEIDGLAVYHVTGALMSKVAQGAPVPVTTYALFISKETMLLRRMVIETDFSELAKSAPSGDPYVPTSQLITYNFHGYNEPVTIELPTASVDLIPTPTPTPTPQPRPTVTNGATGALPCGSFEDTPDSSWEYHLRLKNSTGVDFDCLTLSLEGNRKDFVDFKDGQITEYQPARFAFEYCVSVIGYVNGEKYSTFFIECLGYPALPPGIHTYELTLTGETNIAGDKDILVTATENTSPP